MRFNIFKKECKIVFLKKELLIIALEQNWIHINVKKKFITFRTRRFYKKIELCLLFSRV